MDMKPESAVELAEGKVAFALSRDDIHGRCDSLDPDPGPGPSSDPCLFLCLYPYNGRGHDLYRGRAPFVDLVHYSAAGLV